MKHQFSVAPSADIPRSSFNRSCGYKTTFDAGKLIPIFVDEVLPGDTFNMDPSVFCRINTPLYPLMDNLYLDLHWFFVPYRQIWSNFRKFCGEQEDPGDSIDYSFPTISVGAGGVTQGSLGDYLGLPTKINNTVFSAMPFRAYAHIYNEWFRDQNLVDSVTMSTADGPDSTTNTTLLDRGKRHDYFTSCLPWLQKGDAVSIPLGTSAPVGVTSGSDLDISADGGTTSVQMQLTNSSSALNADAAWSAATGNVDYIGNVTADLSSATAATINQLRQSFQIQKLLERDARSGTRYSEIIKAHFNVDFIDVTYRPEFLGGNTTPVTMQQVAQTSNDGTNGNVGELAAFGVAALQGGGFTKSFTEHGLVMGIASVRADLTYQQGMDRMWRRSTRYDIYWPALAHIGEQAVDMGELYYVDNTTDTDTDGTVDNDEVFGYQERWAEYRYKPSKITGLFRSNATGTLHAWHLSQNLSSPALNETFITENPPMDRVVAVNTEPDFLLDSYFNLQCARPIPLYSVPGLIDHF
jgi:hypothetical protein